ncbi:MAG: DegT/DnrJ/EryC1/StrS family aminotransferase [Elusimicrobia bacterium]|nr:DegT/DnrJ/EryC1/StrS family aminotransferase [Elusimicrobiota bacterium]
MPTLRRHRSTRLAIDGGTPVRRTPLPYRRLFGKNELKMVSRVFQDSWRKKTDFGYQGVFEEAYTRGFCAFQGGGFADAVCSGTAALYVCLRTLDIEPGSDIVVPPVTDPGGVAPAVLVGLKPVVADAAPGSFNMGPAEFKAALTSNTKAVIVAHIGGIPTDAGSIVKIASSRGIKVIEDCSQSHGALVGGRRIGTFGDMAFFSTMFSKNHATGGCGGVVYTRHARYRDRIRSIADRGKPLAYSDFDLKNPNEYLFPSLNLNQDELSCAIGISTLSRLPSMIARRRRIVEALDRALRPALSVRPLTVPKGMSPSPFFYTLTVDTESISVSKTEFAEALAAEGIGVNHDYRNIVAEWPWFRRYLPAGTATPNATALRASSFNVLFNERFGRGEVDDIAAAIFKVSAAFARS